MECGNNRSTPVVIALSMKARRKIIFPRTRARTSTSTSSNFRSGDAKKMADTTDGAYNIPSWFTHGPMLKDDFTTPTSEAQNATIRECLPFLKGAQDPARDPFDFDEHGLPVLNQEDHVDFLEQNLGKFPAQFVGIDASRPWMVYWGLMGLYLLGHDVKAYRSRYASFLAHIDTRNLPTWFKHMALQGRLLTRPE